MWADGTAQETVAVYVKHINRNISKLINAFVGELVFLIYMNYNDQYEEWRLLGCYVVWFL
jgi:hypothetical protein